MPPVPKDEAERNKKSLAVILKQPGNKECADCTAKGPTWCPTNWGVFVCIKCAGIHRKMGTHISKVKSCTLDSWYDREVELVKLVGNKMGKDIYEDSLGKPKPDENDDIVKIEDFIRNKYERRLWMRSGAEEGCIFVAKMLKSNPDALASKEEASTPVEDAPIKQAVQKPKPVPTQTTPIKKPATATKKPVQQDDGPSLFDFGATDSQTSLEVLVTPSTKPNTNLTPVQQQQTFQQQQQHHQQPASKDAIMNMFNTPTPQQQMGYQQPPMYGQQQQFAPQGRGFVPMGHHQPPMYQPPQQQHHHMYPPQGRGFAPMGHQQPPPMYQPQQQQHVYPPQGRGFAPMGQQPMYQPQFPNPAFRGTQQYGYK